MEDLIRSQPDPCLEREYPFEPGSLVTIAPGEDVIFCVRTFDGNIIDSSMFSKIIFKQLKAGEMLMYMKCGWKLFTYCDMFHLSEWGKFHSFLYHEMVLEVYDDSLDFDKAFSYYSEDET